jgi:lipopolysaccharide transport system permease protein
MTQSLKNNQALIIEPGKIEAHYWKDLWQYKELLFVFTLRDISVRYKQTIIGVAWALIRPFMTMVVFTIVFGKFAKMPSEGVPYPILVFVALLPWQFFSGAFSDASNSLVNNSNLISKIYFPRMLIPASAIMVNLVDFIISLGMLVVLMVWYKYIPDWKIIMLPLLTLWVAFIGLGLGLLVASVNVRYRDVRYVLPFVVQFGLYLSPVGFISSIIPEKWRLFYYLNPMAGLIDAYRWSILGSRFEIYFPGILCSAFITFCFLYSGVKYFRSTEKSFVDIL